MGANCPVSIHIIQSGRLNEWRAITVPAALLTPPPRYAHAQAPPRHTASAVQAALSYHIMQNDLFVIAASQAQSLHLIKDD